MQVSQKKGLGFLMLKELFKHASEFPSSFFLCDPAEHTTLSPAASPVLRVPKASPRPVIH